MKIAGLMPTHAHVTNKKNGRRIDIRNYFGLNMIINQIEKLTPSKVDVITYEKINNYEIILVSLHSVEDIYAAIYTLTKKVKGEIKPIIIAGGAAICNIEPLVKYFDFIVIGRGESLIIPLLNSIKKKKSFSHPSVVNKNEHYHDKIYQINYAEKLFPDTINGVKETMYGCKYNCSYCRYRYSALPPNLRNEDKKTTMPGNEETFWDLEIKDGKFHTTSLDGLTQQIRYAVSKPITNKMVIEKIAAFSKVTKKINLKIYFVIGYPGNGSFDLSEIKQTLLAASELTGKCDVFIKLHFTPFSAEPQTPMQWEAMNIHRDYRNELELMRATSPYLIEKENFRVILLRTTNKPLTLLKRAIYNRAFYEDTNILEYLACHTEQITHNSNQDEKLILLIRKYNIKRFVEQKEIGEKIASSNVISWKDNSQVIKEAHKVRKALYSLNQ